MTGIDARAEAAVRYPIGGFGTALRIAFIDGATWESTKDPSEEGILAAMEAYTQYREADGPGDAMRAALRAANEADRG